MYIPYIVTKQYAFDAVTKGNAVTSITRNGINIDSYSYGNAGEMKGMVYGRDNKETMPMNPASSGYTDDAQSGPATWESNAGIDRRGLNEASRYYTDMPYRVNLKQFTGLRPNTIYTFSAWIKDKPETSFPNNSMCIGSNEIYPSNTWQLYSVEVVSDNSGSLSVGFGTLSGWGIDVLITEVSLYQSNNEIKPYDPATSGYTIYEQSGSAIWESNAGNDRRGLNEASRYYSNLPYSRINKKQFTGLKPNTAYTFSAWIKESPGTNYPGYPMRLGLNGCDGINNPIGNYIVIYPEDNWKRFSYECVSDGNGSLAIGFGVWGEIDVLITEVTLVESDVEVEYAYDGAGRLGRVRNDAAGIVVEYIYDGYGRLIKEIEQCPDGMVRSTIRLPMGNQTAYEKISEGTNTITRVYIPFGGKTIAKRESVNGGQAEVSFYHTDNLGSIRGVSGADSATFQYDPYGNTISGEQSEHNLGFTGKPHDSTGLYYFGARFYDPKLGRFINQDPARDGLNWYMYCSNNPLRYIDPTGLYQLAIDGVQPYAIVENGDTLSGIVYDLCPEVDWREVARYNNLENPDLIRVGDKILLPPSVIPDVTSDLTKRMVSAASDSSIANPWYFRAKVRNKGDWDLKNQEDTIYLTGRYKHYVFQGKIVRADAPGNILYGYVGTAAWWSSDYILFHQAGKAQIAAGTSMPKWNVKPYYGDDPSDHYYIELGIKLRRQGAFANGGGGGGGGSAQ